MRIKTALILCAGFGKRLNPNTLKKPKPLLEINNITMLEKCINLVKALGINEIIINTFYLKEQFSKFVKIKNFNIDIHIVEDGKSILDTGGGILNMINHSSENFNLSNNLISIKNNTDFIFVGCQILNKNVLRYQKKHKFSILNIWKKLIYKKKLHGLESKQKFYHLTDLNIFNRLKDL